MSGLPDDRTDAAVPPARVFTAGRFGRVVRATASALLVLAALTVVPSVSPSWRPAQELTADLAAGRVSYIECESGSATVRRVVDQVRWRQAGPRNPSFRDVLTYWFE